MMKKNDKKRSIFLELINKGLIKICTSEEHKGWILKNGSLSPIYIQLRWINSYPELLSDLAEEMSGLIKNTYPNTTRLVGIGFSGIPIATAISLKSKLPAIHIRSADKLSTYGIHSIVEGYIESGDKLCFIDDVITDASSKIQAINIVKNYLKQNNIHNVETNKVITVIDRRKEINNQMINKYKLDVIAYINLMKFGLSIIKSTQPNTVYNRLYDYFNSI